MITVKAITCPKCRDTIYSRALHDHHGCTCGHVFVDGGLDYLRFGWRGGDEPTLSEISVDATKRELYDDWNHSFDKYGLIPGGGE